MSRTIEISKISKKCSLRSLTTCLIIIFVDPLQTTPEISLVDHFSLSVIRLLWCSMNGQPFLSAGQVVKFIKIQLKDQNLSFAFSKDIKWARFESLLGRFWPPDLVFATAVLEIMLNSDCIFYLFFFAM